MALQLYRPTKSFCIIWIKDAQLCLNQVFHHDPLSIHCSPHGRPMRIYLSIICASKLLHWGPSPSWPGLVIWHHVVSLDKDTHIEERLIFSTHQLAFHDDGALTVLFLALKMTPGGKGLRSKFHLATTFTPILLRPCNATYKTEDVRWDKRLVFVALKHPYQAIQHSTIAALPKS